MCAQEMHYLQVLAKTQKALGHNIGTLNLHNIPHYRFRKKFTPAKRVKVLKSWGRPTPSIRDLAAKCGYFSNESDHKGNLKLHTHLKIALKWHSFKIKCE